MEIITRKEAKEQGLKFYFTGKTCKHGHVSKRHVDNAGCVECMKTTQREWRREKPEYMEKYRQNNKDNIKKSMKQYYKKNIEKYKKYNKQYCKENSDKINAKASKRRASKLQRTPTWASQSEIIMWYEVAEVLSRSGVKFHVDHVVPLQGKTVSGFHVENNMQILPAYINISKHNQWNWEIQKHGYA
jgi:hypothetical protein